MAQRKKEAPGLFIQKKKPPVKPAQTSIPYLSNIPAPTALDADKIAKMDAELEKRGINTLKGPKKAATKKESPSPAAQTKVQKPAISQQKVQQSTQTTKKIVTTENIDGIHMVIDHERLADADKNDGSLMAIVKEAQQPVIKQRKDGIPEVTAVEAQKPVTGEEQDDSLEVIAKEAQKPETPKPGICRRVTSLLGARKSAIIQLKKALSQMHLPEAPATPSSSMPAAEQPKTNQPAIATAITSSPVAAISKTPLQSSTPRTLSPVISGPKTPSQATIDIGSLTRLAASVPLPLSPITTTSKTPPQAATPLPLSPVTAESQTPPRSLTPSPLSATFNILRTPPTTATPLSASPVTGWRDTPPQSSIPGLESPVAITPRTPAQPVMAFLPTPETTTNKDVPRAALRFLNYPLSPAPQSMQHVGSTLPPTPDSERTQIPQPYSTTFSPNPLPDVLRQTSEPLPSCAPKPPTQVAVAAPLSRAICPQTPDTTTPWNHSQSDYALAYNQGSPSLEPRDVAGPMTLGSAFCPQMPKTAAPNNCFQVAFTLPQTPETPTSEPPPLREPMILSSSIYDMSPGHSIHETPELTEFVMSCVPKTLQPLPAWELYFNKNLANTISAFSANCRFEHPGSNRQNSNPFSALTGGGNNNRGPFGRPAGSEAIPFSLNRDVIYKDITEERPSWILSAYGPGRDAPEQLWGGYPIEQSFEEARLHFVMGQMAGNPQGAVSSSLFEVTRQETDSAFSSTKSKHLRIKCSRKYRQLFRILMGPSILLSKRRTIIRTVMTYVEAIPFQAQANLPLASVL